MEKYPALAKVCHAATQHGKKFLNSNIVCIFDAQYVVSSVPQRKLPDCPTTKKGRLPFKIRQRALQAIYERERERQAEGGEAIICVSVSVFGRQYNTKNVAFGLFSLQ